MTIGTFALIYLALLLIKRMGDRQYAKQQAALDGGGNVPDAAAQPSAAEAADADEPGYRQSKEEKGSE